MYHCNGFISCEDCAEWRCPEYREKRIGTCGICNKEIFESERYIFVNGEYLHHSCAEDNVKEVFNILDVNIYDVITEFAEGDIYDA